MSSRSCNNFQSPSRESVQQHERNCRGDARDPYGPASDSYGASQPSQKLPSIGQMLSREDRSLPPIDQALQYGSQGQALPPLRRPTLPTLSNMNPPVGEAPRDSGMPPPGYPPSGTGRNTRPTASSFGRTQSSYGDVPPPRREGSITGVTEAVGGMAVSTAGPRASDRPTAAQFGQQPLESEPCSRTSGTRDAYSNLMPSTQRDSRRAGDKRHREGSSERSGTPADDSRKVGDKRPGKMPAYEDSPSRPGSSVSQRQAQGVTTPGTITRDWKAAKIHSDDSVECNLANCEQPGVVFTDRSAFNAHVARDHQKKDEFYICELPKCLIDCKTMAIVRQHMRSREYHADEQVHVCKHAGCDQAYPKAYMLQAHQFNDHGDHTGRFMCDECRHPTSFESPDKLQAHILSIHRDEDGQPLKKKRGGGGGGGGGFERGASGFVMRY